MKDGTEDIVARLRSTGGLDARLLCNAADEIERLRNLCSEHRSQAMTFYAELVRLKQQQRADGK